MRASDNRLLWFALAAWLTAGAAGCREGTGSFRFGAAGAADEELWAIECVTFDGAGRITQADNCLEHLRHVEGLRGDLAEVIHSDEVSTVYYGRYRRVYDARRDAEEFRPDPIQELKLIRQLSMVVNDPAAGRRTVWPFRFATIRALPTESTAPAEWRLANAPGVYSLQVAVFYNTEGMRQRKSAAEQYCKLMREQGEEAYFDHGSLNSSVCLGSFGADALRTFQRRDAMTGRIEVKRKIVDERMRELQRRYPHNLHNGRTLYDVSRDPLTGEKTREPHFSFPVLIPGREPPRG